MEGTILALGFEINLSYGRIISSARGKEPKRKALLRVINLISSYRPFQSSSYSTKSRRNISWIRPGGSPRRLRFPSTRNASAENTDEYVHKRSLFLIDSVFVNFQSELPVYWIVQGNADLKKKGSLLRTDSRREGWDWRWRFVTYFHELAMLYVSTFLPQMRRLWMRVDELRM